MSGEARFALTLLGIYWVFFLPYFIDGSIKMNRLLKQMKIQHEDE
ncbi:MAG: hypothetical protein Q8Q95_02635 [bacterium]|nr:hypothetical protein [bacterium]